MSELTILLNNVEDTYYDFVLAMVRYAEKKPSRRDLLLDFIKSNPHALSSDIIEFVSNQPDFAEDAACAQTV